MFFRWSKHALRGPVPAEYTRMQGPDTTGTAEEAFSSFRWPKDVLGGPLLTQNTMMQVVGTTQTPQHPPTSPSQEVENTAASLRVPEEAGISSAEGLFLSRRTRLHGVRSFNLYVLWNRAPRSPRLSKILLLRHSVMKRGVHDFGTQ
jgi:hypothetical protein